MRVTDRWRSNAKPTLSFELFPARSEKAVPGLERAITALAALEPDFVSVTFGAGGSTREGSRQLIEALKCTHGLGVMAYFACYGLGPDEVSAVLNDYQALGVENILAVRGDPPQDEGFAGHPDSLAHASELVTLMRARYDFCVGVAGYPEGHIHAPSREEDLAFLKLKVDQGAEYIIANYFYDNAYFLDFVERCRALSIDVPILPGIMPVYSVKMMNMLANLCGATITDELREGLAALPEGDKDALSVFGIEFATRQCAALLQAGAPGLHIYTMDRSASALGIVQGLREQGLL